MDAHPEDAQQTVPDVVTEVAAEPADDAPAEGTPTLDAAAEPANAREEAGGDSVDTIIAPEGAEAAADVAPTEPDAGELSMTDCESDNEPLAAKDELMDSTAAEYEAAEVLEGAAVENVLHVTAVEVVNDDDDDEGAVPLHRRGAHPEAWRMNGTLQTWRPIGKTGLTPENSEDEDEEDGLMIVAAAAPRE